MVNYGSHAQNTCQKNHKAALTNVSGTCFGVFGSTHRKGSIIVDMLAGQVSLAYRPRYPDSGTRGMSDYVCADD